MIKFLSTIILTLLCIPFLSCNSHIARIESWYTSKAPFTATEISLKGKVIMLDPGHGNANGGAHGRGGTIERDVNLQVAVYLKRMLEEKGATVYMIREGAASSWWNDSMGYVRDLAIRCRIRDSIQPDLYLSLHHNGTADSNTTDNIPKVFYPVSDPGASLDIAQYINSAFTERLGLGPGELYCANYYILRKPSVPTVLGEASYLSNPKMERMLNDTNVLKYEALVYLEGICAWVKGGLVSIRSFSFDTSTSEMTMEIQSDSAIDPLLTQVQFNGKKLPGILHGNKYTVNVPDNIPNGLQQFTVVAMNRNGRSSMKKTLQVTINRKPADMKIISNSREFGQIVKITATVSDNRGCTVIDSTEVVCNNDTAYTKDGDALFYLQQKEIRDSLSFSCMSITKKVTIDIAKDSDKVLQGFVYSDDNATPIAHCSVMVDSLVTFTDRFGFFSLLTTGVSGNSSVRISANGYSDTLIHYNDGLFKRIAMSAVASGVLIGKRIVIDPEYGGTETGGINKHGIRASDKNRAVAISIAAILERHGANVIMARNDDRTVTLTERLETAEQHDAKCYIIIRTDSVNTDPAIVICQGSDYGRRIAESMKSHWKKITGETIPIREKVSFILQQTRCPAIVLSLCQFENKQVVNTEKSEMIAQMVVDGLTDYFRPKMQ